MGFFTKWDDSEAPEESELEQQKPSVPTPVEVTVKLTRNFIKLINNIDDIASANGWTMTVSFPEEGLDIALKSPNYCFYISSFEMDADNTDPAQIKKNLAKEVIDITRDFALGDYVYAKELAQLQKDHKTIQESDVRRYIQEGNTIRANIDGFVGGTFGAYTYHLNAGWANGILHEQFGTANPDLKPLEIINNLTCLPPHEGAGRTTRPYFMDGMAVFAYDCSDAIMERMLAIWDWSLTDEGWMETNFGIEGIDYELDENGTPKRLPAWSERSTQAKIAGMTSWGGAEWIEKLSDFKALPEGVTNADMIAYAMKLVNIANEACHNPDVTFNMAASLITTEERASFMFDYRGGLLEIVTGTDDVEAMYDAFVANAYAAGVQAVIDAENEVLNK